MDGRIFKNSYVVFLIAFAMLCVIFYVFELGYTVEVGQSYPDNKPTVKKRFSWKYPLAFSLLVWIIWHFYVYPPPEELESMQSDKGKFEPIVNNQSGIMPNRIMIPKNHMNIQKINMMNWN